MEKCFFYVERLLSIFICQSKVFVQRERLNFKEEKAFLIRMMFLEDCWKGGKVQSTGTEINFRQEERSSSIVTGGNKSRVCADAGNGVCLVRSSVKTLLSYCFCHLCEIENEDNYQNSVQRQHLCSKEFSLAPKEV